MRIERRETGEVAILTMRELEKLDEYSCSLPTGTKIGKRWKRNENAYVKPPVAFLHFFDGTAAWETIRASWWLGEYAAHEDPDKVKILWRPILIEG